MFVKFINYINVCVIFALIGISVVTLCQMYDAIHDNSNEHEKIKQYY